jgi:SpoIVB peptidase S55
MARNCTHPDCNLGLQLWAATSNLVDVWNLRKETAISQIFRAQAFVAVIATTSLMFTGTGFAGVAEAQSAPVTAPGGALSPPPSSGGFFPLAQVKRGLKGTAWTVFEGTVPEPMDVEILGVLHGARGPGRDMILARLHGAKPEYTGVVAGMSGSPVYIDGKLLGALSYRIGQFSKEPIAGITPIEQMLEVRDLPLQTASPIAEKGAGGLEGGGLTFSAMETPLLMSGFQPEAIRVWKERMAGTGLEVVSAGGAAGGDSGAGDDFGPMVPGSAVSLELVRGDLEIAATCTVTYIDPKQLLACGHPVLQAGPVSLPMTTTEVVATLASPLNAFKIVNTGKTIGAFTEDRDAAIRGELGAQARMIPVSISVMGSTGSVERKIEITDLPSLTPSAMLVSVYQVLLQSNQSTAETSYHVTGEITVHGMPPVPVDAWGTPGESMASQLAAAFAVGDSFNRLYTNATREAPMESVKLHIEAVPHDLRTQLESVRLISSSIVHAGDTVVVEATLRPWEQPARNVRLGFTVPARLQPGTVRLLVGSAASLDRTLEAARPATQPLSVTAASARLRGLHEADQLYVSLLLPETQASLEGRTLDSLPLSMANTMESERSGVEVGLHGESVVVAAETAAGGVLSGQQILNLRVEAGGGLH